MGTSSYTPDLTFYDSSFLHVGAVQGGNVDKFTGKMSCLQFYDSELSQEEIIRRQYQCQEHTESAGKSYFVCPL